MSELPEFFGLQNERAIRGRWLENARGTRVCVLDFGGIVQEYSLATETGRLPLVLSYTNASDYLLNPFKINKQIGRVAGRIAGATFDLFGRRCPVEANEGHNCLHGGSRGLDRQTFQLEPIDGQHLRLRLALDEARDGFPGALDLTIDYQLAEDDRLTVRYEALAQSATVFDPTLHIYWALPRDLAGCTLHIPAGEHFGTDGEKLPTTADGRADCSSPRSLTDLIGELGRGLDDCYRVPGDLSRPAAILTSPDYRVELYSDRNGLVLFSANPLDGAAHDAGHYNALATELQTLPNSLARPELGDIRLRAGQSHQSTLIFHPRRGKTCI